MLLGRLVALHPALHAERGYCTRHLYVRRKRMSYVFVREWSESEQAYRVKQQDFDLAPAEARKARPNASLLATAAQYGVPQAQELLQAMRVYSNVNWIGRQTTT
ncbi:MAG: hypothetical protein V9G10_07600 [Candidatus Nanopelagicales bacterium]